METLFKQVFNACFFYLCLSIPLALGLATLVSGMAANLSGDLPRALALYLTGFISLSAAHWVFFTGRRILRYS